MDSGLRAKDRLGVVGMYGEAKYQFGGTDIFMGFGRKKKSIE